jgi:hypothetical protein
MSVERPALEITESDPIKLDNRLRELQAAQLRRKIQGLQIPEGTSQGEADRLRREWNSSYALEIKEMIGITMKLRRTSAGPAAKGGKRAKRAPLDMDAVIMDMGLEKA